MASMANVRELFPPFFFFSFLTFFLTEPFAELFVVFFVDFPAGLFFFVPAFDDLKTSMLTVSRMTAKKEQDKYKVPDVRLSL